MIKKRRDYRHEILQILKKQRVYGFNNLCKIGNFHRTSLKSNLKKLENAGEITIHKHYSNKTVYSLSDFNLDSIIQTVFPKIFQLKEKKFSLIKNNKEKHLKKLAKEIFSAYFSVDLLLLGSYDFDISRGRLDMVEKIKGLLEQELNVCFYHLSPSDKEEILFFQNPKNQGEKILKTFRKTWQKYNIS